MLSRFSAKPNSCHSSHGQNLAAVVAPCAFSNSFMFGHYVWTRPKFAYRESARKRERERGIERRGWIVIFRQRLEYYVGINISTFPSNQSEFQPTTLSALALRVFARANYAQWQTWEWQPHGQSRGSVSGLPRGHCHTLSVHIPWSRFPIIGHCVFSVLHSVTHGMNLQVEVPQEPVHVSMQCIDQAPQAF